MYGLTKAKWHHSNVLSATFVIKNDASADDDSHKISQNVPHSVPRLITLLNDCVNHQSQDFCVLTFLECDQTHFLTIPYFLGKFIED